MQKVFFFLFFLPIFCFSQEKIFHGKIETGSMLQGILVVNLAKETETKTDGFGQFSIKAEEGDLLIFSSEFIHRKRFLVETEHLTKENIIQLEIKDIEIKAVEIEDYGVNSVSLGLVEKGYKPPTQAERKLISAIDKGTGNLASIINIINTITGRKRMLKNILKMEIEDQRSDYLSEIFEESFFLETLKIKSEDISEFKLFALYQIPEGLEKEKLEFFLIQVAEEYRLIKYETENYQDKDK